MDAYDRDPAQILPDGTAPRLNVPLAPDRAPRPTNAARIIYVGLVMVPLLLGAAVILINTGMVAGQTSTARTPWDLAVIFLGITTTVVMGFYVTRRLPRLLTRARAGGDDQLSATIEFAVLATTAPFSTILAVGSFMVWAGLGGIPLPDDPMTPLVLSASAILIACAPSAAFDIQRGARIRAIEKRFPDLLRDLNESHAAGMTMAQAIRVASRGDYGRLNTEIQKMAHQISWGTPFPDALTMFGERVDTPLVVRAVALINKATRAGGNVKDVLAAAARDAREIESLNSDRRSGMALYVIVIYVAYGVFLSVVAALQALLVPSLLASTQGAGVSRIGNVHVGGRLSLDDFRFMYFGVGIVQAIGSGVVAGVMSEGTLESGLKHATILVALTILSLGILL